MIRRASLFFVLMLSVVIAQAQDPVFSQFYSAPLQINPAFTGITHAPHLSLNYRNQWPSLNRAYVTYAAYYNQYAKDLNSGFGLSILSDDAGNGLLKTNKLSGFYSYQLEINRELFIKIGMEGSVVQARYNWNAFLFPDQLDDRFGQFTPGGAEIPTEETQPDDLNTTYFDASAGILVYSKKFYAGLAMKHLNTPNESLLDVNNNLNVGLPMRFAIHGGMQITLVEGNKRQLPTFISPNVMFVRQGDFGQFNAGAFANVGLFFAGTWYRHALSNPDAVILLVGVHKDFFRIGYSYDVTVSGLAGYTGGSHEISVTLNFDRDRGVDYNDCFQLFR